MTPRRRMLLLAALAGPGAARATAPLLTDVRPGDALLAAALHDLDHAPARLPAGQPLLVNFWARWCGPCKVEIPELVALNARRTGVAIVGIAIENQGPPVRDFARAYDIDYRVLLARDGSGLDLMRALGNAAAGLPFTVALDRRGRIVARRLGLITREQLDQSVQLALG
ncbi:MAG: TlpA disulfide reductase family protein [Rubrivivax sp.]